MEPSAVTEISLWVDEVLKAVIILFCVSLPGKWVWELIKAPKSYQQERDEKQDHELDQIKIYQQGRDEKQDRELLEIQKELSYQRKDFLAMHEEYLARVNEIKDMVHDTNIKVAIIETMVSTTHHHNMAMTLKKVSK